MRVGDQVEVCRVFGHQSRDEAKSPIYVTRIARETATQWVAADGCRFLKKDLSLTPRYLDYDTFIRKAAQR